MDDTRSKLHTKRIAILKAIVSAAAVQSERNKFVYHMTQSERITLCPKTKSKLRSIIHLG